MEVAECIKDGFDAAMKSYLQSNEYQQGQQQIKTKTAELRVLLNECQQKKLNELLNAITTVNGLLAAEAYMRGVVEGIALHSSI